MKVKNGKENILIVGGGAVPDCEAHYTSEVEEIEYCKAIFEAGGRPVLMASASVEQIASKFLKIPVYSVPFFQSHIEAILEKEEIDAVFAPFVDSAGWKAVLNLERHGYWKKNKIRIIRSSLPRGYEKNRLEKVRGAISKINVNQPRCEKVLSMSEAEDLLNSMGGLPVLLRTGDGETTKLTNLRDFNFQLSGHLKKGRSGEVYLADCLENWREISVGVLKDRFGAAAVVFTSEQVMPAGIFRVRQVAVSPIQTLCGDGREYLHRAALSLVGELDHFTGFCSVRFAVGSPEDNIQLTDISFSTKRSAAVSLSIEASLINILAKLAMGYRLDDLEFLRDDYDKNSSRILLSVPGTGRRERAENLDNPDMVSRQYGETIYAGDNFCEVLQKCRGEREAAFSAAKIGSPDRASGDGCPLDSYWDQLDNIYQACHLGISVKKIREASNIDPWFLVRIERIVDLEQQLQRHSLSTITKQQWEKFKKYGFSDTRIADILSLRNPVVTENDVLEKREEWRIQSPVSTISFGPARAVNRGRAVVIVTGIYSDPGRISLKTPALLLIDEARRLEYRIVLITADIDLLSFWASLADQIYMEPLSWEALHEVCTREEPSGIFIEGACSGHKNLKKSLNNLKIPIVHMPVASTFPGSGSSSKNCGGKE